MALTRFISWEVGDPIDPNGASLLVVNHGYHSGLILTRQTLETHASPMGRIWLADFPDADWFEFGWGDQGFYSGVPTWSDLSIGVAARALLIPSPSVMHIATEAGDPKQVFSRSDLLELRLSDQAMALLVTSIEAGAASNKATGPGLYLNSLFYPGQGSYTAFNTCNSWVSQRLRAAGLASGAAPSLFSGGLLWDLRRRYGVK